MAGGSVDFLDASDVVDELADEIPIVDDMASGIGGAVGVDI